MSDQKFKEKRRSMFSDIISGKGKQSEGSRKRKAKFGSISEHSTRKQRTSAEEEMEEQEVSGNE